MVSQPERDCFLSPVLGTLLVHPVCQYRQNIQKRQTDGGKDRDKIKVTDSKLGPTLFAGCPPTLVSSKAERTAPVTSNSLIGVLLGPFLYHPPRLCPPTKNLSSPPLRRPRHRSLQRSSHGFRISDFQRMHSLKRCSLLCRTPFSHHRHDYTATGDCLCNKIHKVASTNVSDATRTCGSRDAVWKPQIKDVCERQQPRAPRVALPFEERGKEGGASAYERLCFSFCRFFLFSLFAFFSLLPGMHEMEECPTWAAGRSMALRTSADRARYFWSNAQSAQHRP